MRCQTPNQANLRRADLDQVVRRAGIVGIEKMICIADTIEEGERCLEIARQYPQVFCTMGVHPHVASAFRFDQDLQIIRESFRESKCRAVGEIGLDYHYMNSPKDTQQRVFEAQQLFDMPDMYAAIFAAGALGYGLNLLFLLIEKRFVHWSGK